jgi:hypothetical protein
MCDKYRSVIATVGKAIFVTEELNNRFIYHSNKTHSMALG